MRTFQKQLFPFLCCAAMLSWATAQDADRLPTVEGDSLAGQRIVLPDAAAGKISVLVFGFTKASKEPTTAWANKILKDFAARPDFLVYQLPVLEDVPRFIRGMVIGGMKKGVAEDKRAHFVPIPQKESELKKFVHYKEPDNAYVVVLSRSGETLLMTHDGGPGEASYERVRNTIDAALKQK